MLGRDFCVLTKHDLSRNALSHHKNACGKILISGITDNLIEIKAVGMTFLSVFRRTETLHIFVQGQTIFSF